MTVKEIFELRKQGKIEEAYEAIRPMYAVHQGKYTTLCMFWTASDILKLRIEQKRIDEAEKIFIALLRVMPDIDDSGGKAFSAILHHALRMADASPNFKMLDFADALQVEKLTQEHWKQGMSSDGKHPLPSTAQRMLTRCFHEIQQNPDADHALKAMPLLTAAMQRNPNDRHNRRYQAVIYTIMGERDKAADIYRQLLRRYHDSYLYAELAELTEEPGPKAALLCQAILNQRQPQFRTGYHQALAQLLAPHDRSRAAYELQQCLKIREKQKLPLSRSLRELQQQLEGTTPPTDAQQQDFYRRMAAKYPVNR